MLALILSTLSDFQTYVTAGKNMKMATKKL